MKNEATETISVSLPGWLIERLDLTAKQRFMSRSAFISEALRKHILTNLDNPEFWKSLDHEDEKPSC